MVVTLSHGFVFRFFFGKNKVMQLALGRSESDEYKDNLHQVSSVSGRERAAANVLNRYSSHFKSKISILLYMSILLYNSL